MEKGLWLFCDYVRPFSNGSVCEFNIIASVVDQIH